MKYLKTFESFTVVNEAQDLTSQHKGVHDELEKKINSMSEADKAKLKTELENFAKTLGLTIEQMADPKMVAAAMDKKEFDKKIETEIPVTESIVNESIKETWGKIKNYVKDKFWNILTKVGLTGMIAGLVPVCMEAIAKESATNMADITGGTMSPGTATVVGGIAIAVSFAVMMVGLKKSGAMDK